MTVNPGASPTEVNLGNVPAAATGKKLVDWQAGAAYPDPNNPQLAVRDVSAEFPNIGGVDARTTTSETISLASQGKLVTLSNASAVAVTLDSAGVAAGFTCFAANLGAGAATLTPSSGNIDGLANLALTQYQGVTLFFDGTNWRTVRGISSGSGGSGGVNAQTNDYTAVSGDNGKLISMNKGTAVTLTLPAGPPSGTWWIALENIGAGALTVNRNGLTIDGAAANLTLSQNLGCLIFTDGSNYFSSRGVDAIPARASLGLNAGTIAFPGEATGNMALGKCSVLYTVVASNKCRLRLYSTAAGQTADASRAVGVKAAWGVGLLVELVLDTTPLLTFTMQPPALCENLDGTPATSIYWTVDNLDGASQTYTFTFVRLVLE